MYSIRNAGLIVVGAVSVMLVAGCQQRAARNVTAEEQGLTEEPVLVETSVPTEEPAPDDQSASIDEVVMSDEAAPANEPAPPEEPSVDDAPVVTDQAIALRDWDLTVASYANGDTVADSTGLLIAPNEKADWPDVVADPVIATVNLVTLSGTILLPPWGPRPYQGVVLPPTHYAMPASVPGEPVGEPVAMEPQPEPAEQIDETEAVTPDTLTEPEEPIPGESQSVDSPR